MKKIIFWAIMSVLSFCSTITYAQFNANNGFQTINNQCGTYFLQSGTYYDSHGTSVGSSLPACPGSMSTQLGSDVSITGGSITGAVGAIPTYSSSGVAASSVHAVKGTATLSGGTVTVTLTNSAIFSSASSYVCVANDQATSPNAVNIQQASGSSITFKGNSTDVVQYLCVGN